MTFASLLSAAYDELNYGSSPSSDVVTRIKRWINEGHRNILRLPAFQGLRTVTYPFDSVAAQKTYGLAAFDRLDRIVDVDNQKPLPMKDLAWLRSADPGDAETGTPSVWVPLGIQPVAIQPSSTGLWVVSTSAADTAIVIYLRGLRATGQISSEVATTLTGASRVALGTATDYVAVVELFLSVAAAGTVSLYNASSSGTELAQIPIGNTSTRYRGVRLWPTPTAAVSYNVDGQFSLPDLAQNSSVSRVPEEFEELLLKWVRFCDARKKGHEGRMKIELAMFEKGLKDLASVQEFPADFRAVASEGRSVGANNLGGWFPSDYIR